jgi:hypothetical protein
MMPAFSEMSSPMEAHRIGIAVRTAADKNVAQNVSCRSSLMLTHLRFFLRASVQFPKVLG